MPPGWPACVALSRSEGEGLPGNQRKGTAASIASEPHVVQSAYREPSPSPFFTLNMVAASFFREAVENGRKPEMTEPHINSGAVSSRCSRLSPCLGPRGFQGVGAPPVSQDEKQVVHLGQITRHEAKESAVISESPLAFCLGSKAVLLLWTPEVPFACV